MNFKPLRVQQVLSHWVPSAKPPPKSRLERIYELLTVTESEEPGVIPDKKSNSTPDFTPDPMARKKTSNKKLINKPKVHRYRPVPKLPKDPKGRRPVRKKGEKQFFVQ